MPVTRTQVPLDPDWKGVPPDAGLRTTGDLAATGWHPADGHLNLPLLSLDLPTFEANVSTMLALCQAHGAAIAPHIKTPMAPDIARMLLAAGAWGVSVADLRQAGVMLRSGLRRLLLANEIGGRAAAGRLAALLGQHADAELTLFVDSPRGVADLAAAWAEDEALPPMRLLVEVGCGRGGTESQDEVEDVIAAIAGSGDPRLALAGVAAYEGTARRPDAAATARELDALFGRIETALAAVRTAVPERALLLSAGGSSLFDPVLTRSGPLAAADGGALLLLRSGACFFCDHGPVRERLEELAARRLLGPDWNARIETSFQPTLRPWGEVLSLRSDGTAICGIGMRDVAHDQGLPVPLTAWRGGRPASDLRGTASVDRLNDQHAFVTARGAGLEVGDVIEFGVRHPCTTLDKHGAIYALNERGKLTAVLHTCFG